MSSPKKNEPLANIHTTKDETIISYPNNISTWIGYLLLLLGVISIILAYYLNNFILANLALGLLFWGTLFNFIRPEEYIELEVLISSIIPYYSSLYKIIQEGEYKGPPTYISGGTFESLVDPIIFITKKADEEITNFEDLFDGKIYHNSPPSLIITPPGVGLMRLMEQEILGTFTTFELRELNDKIKKSLVERFNLLEAITIEITSETIIITMKGNMIYNELIKRTQDSRINLIGDIISSAIACILARITLNPVKIISIVPMSNDIISVEYKIIKD